MNENKKESFALRENARQMQTDDVVEIDLIDLARHVLKFWPLIILGALIGALFMGGRRYVQPYTYSSSSMLYVLSSTTSITQLTDLQMGSELSDDFVVMVKSNPVLDQAVKDVEKTTGKEITREEAYQATTVSHTDDTRILTITCKTEDAELSKALCDAITEVAAERVSEITQADSPTLVEGAEVAEKPNGRGVVSGMEKGGLLGAFAIVAFLSLIYLLNDKIRKSEDIENYLGEAVIGIIPYEKSLIFRPRRRR